MNPLLNGMNDRQAEAVQTTEGPLLIMAGAGSGKTRVLTHRIAYLIDEKMVNPWNILAITFTNKAAGELKERLKAMLGDTMGGDVFASTFHSACVRILRRDAERIGFPKSFTIYDSDDQQRVIKQIYKELMIDDKFLPVKSAISQISGYKDKLLSAKDVAAEAPRDTKAALISKIYTAYSNRLRTAGAMDFDRC